MDAISALTFLAGSAGSSLIYNLEYKYSYWNNTKSISIGFSNKKDAGIVFMGRDLFKADQSFSTNTYVVFRGFQRLVYTGYDLAYVGMQSDGRFISLLDNSMHMCPTELACIGFSLKNVLGLSDTSSGGSSSDA